MRKSTWIVLAAFAALLVGAVVLLTQKREKGITRLSLTVDKDKLDRIVIKGKNPVELKKQGEDWLLANGRLADATAVRRLVDPLGKLESSDFVTSDSAKLGDLDLDDEKGSRLVAYIGDKEVVNLVVGKTAGGGAHVLHDGDIFRVRGLSPSIVSKAQSAWAERKLFTDKLEEVTRLEVKLQGQTPYVLVKKDNAWEPADAAVLPKGFRFDPDGARALVSGVANARAKDYEDTDPGVEKTGLGDTADVLSFTVQPQPPKAAEDKVNPNNKDQAAPAPVEPLPALVRTVRLGLVKEGQKDVYAKVDGRSDLFTLAEGTVKNFRKALTDLRDLKMVKVDKAKVQKLTVYDGKNTHVFDKKDGVWALTKTSETVPAGFELDPAAVERRVNALVNAKGAKLATDKANSGLGAPSAKVTVGVEGEKSVTLAFGKETKDDDKEMIYAQGNADGEVYLTTKWTKSSLTGGIGSFKKQAEQPQLDPQALSGLPPDVRDQLMRQMQNQGRERKMLDQLQGKVPKGGPMKAPLPATKAP